MTIISRLSPESPRQPRFGMGVLRLPSETQPPPTPKDHTTFYLNVPRGSRTTYWVNNDGASPLGMGDKTKLDKAIAKVKRLSKRAHYRQNRRELEFRSVELDAIEGLIFGKPQPTGKPKVVSVVLSKFRKRPALTFEDITQLHAAHCQLMNLQIGLAAKSTPTDLSA